MTSRKVEISVGFFVALGIAALIFLALKVASAGVTGSGETYTIHAKFDNIGGLKVRFWRIMSDEPLLWMAFHRTPSGIPVTLTQKSPASCSSKTSGLTQFLPIHRNMRFVDHYYIISLE